MTDVQQRAIAAGFLHALQTTPALFQEWKALAKDDYAAIGTLIQKTVGLNQVPSSSDIQAMAQYIDAHLKDQVEAVKAAYPDTPGHVGLIAATQQN